MLHFLFLACTGGEASDSADSGEAVDTNCPGMDCQEAFTGWLIDAIGAPVSAFRVMAAMDNGEDSQFDCPGGSDGVGSCLESGFVLKSRFTTASLTLTDAAAEQWVGEVTADWADAVGMVEECGEYCDVASKEFRLE